MNTQTSSTPTVTDWQKQAHNRNPNGREIWLKDGDNDNLYAIYSCPRCNEFHYHLIGSIELSTPQIQAKLRHMPSVCPHEPGRVYNFDQTPFGPFRVEDEFDWAKEEAKKRIANLDKVMSFLFSYQQELPKLYPRTPVSPATVRFLMRQ